MKKLHVLIPSLVATVGMPLVSMVGCGNGQDDPTPPEPDPAVTTYTVTFELGEGSIEGLTGNTMTVNENTTYGMLPSPKLTGFSFNGWTVNGNDVKLTDVITSDVTVTAKWVEDEDGKFDVTIESDNMLDISINEGITGATFWTIISHHEGYDDGNWIIPDNRIYYDVMVDDKPFYDFHIKKIDIEDEFNYDIMFYTSLATAYNNMTIKVKPYCKYLTFTLDESKNVDVNITLAGDASVGFSSIWYTNNLAQGFSELWNIGDTLTLNNEHKQIYILNPNTTFSKPNNYLHFVSSSNNDRTGRFNCSGNIMSLLNFDGVKEYCFHGLFQGDVELQSTPLLPSTPLPNECFGRAFEDCNITEVILPAEDISNKKPYDAMFSRCRNLNKIKVGFGTKDSCNWPSSSTNAWLEGSTSTTGTFIWKGSPLGPETRGEDTVPEGWTIQTWE